MTEQPNPSRSKEIDNSTNAEKDVHRETIDGQDLAVKIYRLLDSDEVPQDRSALAQAEFDSYKRLAASPLDAYIPAPHSLVYDENTGECIGLRVAWFEGEDLAKVKKPVLTHQEAQRFKEAVAATIEMGLKITPEMLHSQNLLFNSDAIPRLRFSECLILDDEIIVEYMGQINTLLFDLESDYVDMILG